ncbi:CDP-alcohol phosphatidyltransferase family protein [Desulfurobacterium sp.]
MVNIPNFVTVVRALIVPLFIMAVHYKDFRIALFLFVVAALSDAIDGFLARRLEQITVVGVIMDPLADKALIDSAFIVLSYFYRIIPPWLSILVISRDILIIAGGWLLTAFGKMDRIRPILVGKLTAFSQFLTIFFTLLYLNLGGFYLKILLRVLYLLTGGLTVISGIVYVIIGIRELNSE